MKHVGTKYQTVTMLVVSADVVLFAVGQIIVKSVDIVTKFVSALMIDIQEAYQQ